MEYIDTYDDNCKFIGSFDRNTVHRQGLWHNTFQCWIIRRYKGKSFILFQKRHPLKDTFPNLYDTSSAGHLLKGESARDGIRELEEELGLKVSFESLTFLGKMIQTKIGQNYIDREICNIFMLYCDLNIQSYKIQREELCGLIEVDIEDFQKLIQNIVVSIHVTGFEMDCRDNRIEIDRSLCLDAFVPHDIKYYSFVLDRIRQVQA